MPALYALWQQRDDRARALLLMFSGYVICMLPWWWRNVDVVGAIMSPAGVRTLWLTAYDEIFTYPGRVLTPAHWWASGLDSILKARVQALGINIQRLIGENGILILWPFIVAGAGKLWGRLHVRVGALYLTTLFCTMTAVFPFVGSRGGLFHSGVATLPLSLALVPAGYQAVLDWASARRGWDRDRATKVFSVAGFILVGLLTLGLFWTRVIGPDINTPVWEQPQRSYEAIGRAINEVDHSPGVVAVNNPPGFYLATGMDSLVVPSGGLDTLRAAVSAFGVEWVVLDVNRPVGLAGLYAGDTDVGWLVLTRELNGVPFEPVRIYHVELGS
jgi:hypothetical protein